MKKKNPNKESEKLHKWLENKLDKEFSYFGNHNEVAKELSQEFGLPQEQVHSFYIRMIQRITKCFDNKYLEKANYTILQMADTLDKIVDDIPKIEKEFKSLSPEQLEETRIAKLRELPDMVYNVFIYCHPEYYPDDVRAMASIKKISQEEVPKYYIFVETYATRQVGKVTAYVRQSLKEASMEVPEPDKELSPKSDSTAASDGQVLAKRVHWPEDLPDNEDNKRPRRIEKRPASPEPENKRFLSS